MRVGTVRLWIFVLLTLPCVGLRAEADEKPPSSAATDYGGLHPFGVRGLERPFGRFSKERRPFVEAIDRGLDWLVAHQHPDGRFAPHQLGEYVDGKKVQAQLSGRGKSVFSTGVTALCALALLGRGHDGRSEDARDVALRRALEWLVQGQDKEGCFGRAQSGHYVYNHAFAAYALVEAFGVTGERVWLAAAQRGLDFLALLRNPYVAWRYGLKPGDNDTSVSACCMLAVLAGHRVNQSARAVGLAEPFVIDPGSMSGMQMWRDKMTDSDSGRVGYVTRGQGGDGYKGSPIQIGKWHVQGNTASMLWWNIEASRLGLLEGVKGDGVHRNPLVVLMRDVCTKQLPTWSKHGADLYYWFYASMAFYALGEKTWTTWREPLAQLLEGQRKDGSRGEYLGSWNPIGVWCNHGGRLYATSMAILTLEAPARLPDTRPVHKVIAEALKDKTLAPAARARVLALAGRRQVKGARTLLRKAARSKVPDIRVGALDGLRYLGAAHKSVLTTIAKALGDEEARVRVAAIRAALALAPADAVLRALIEQAAEDVDPGVREAAALALGAAGATSESGRQALEKALGKEEPRARLAAAKALRGAGYPPAKLVSALVAVLASKDSALERGALEEIDALGPEAATAAGAVEPFLQSTVPWTRYHAASALWKMRKQKGDLETALAGILSDQDEALALRVVALMRASGTEGQAGVEQLVPLLACGEGDLRRFAMERLGVLGRDDPGAVLGLAHLRYTTFDEEDATAAIAALEQMGVSETRALMALVDGLSNAEFVTRARWALKRAGEAAVPALIQGLDAKGLPARLAALDLLRGLGPKASKARARLKALLKTAVSAAVRVRVVGVLEALGAAADGGVAALVKVLETEHDKAVLGRTIWALGRHTKKDPAALKALCAALERLTDAKLQQGVIRALDGTVNASEETRDALILAAALSPHAKVRYAALHSLEGVKPKSETLLRVFTGVLGDPDESVRHLAVGLIRDHWSASEVTLPSLLIALESDDWYVRREAGGMFVQGGKALVRPLRAIWKKGERRVAVSRAMGWIGKPGLASLKYWVNSRKRDERLAATYGLGIMGRDREIWAAKELIFKRTRIEKDAEVKQALSDAIWGDMRR